jgi:hypothetical protein
MPTSESGSVEVYPLRYTAALLKALPEDEAVFFLMCGQLQNDLVILMRQLLQARIVEGDAEPLRLASATAAMLNMRTLAGRLEEGGKFLRGRFQQVLLRYEANVKIDAKTDLAWLNRYFSSKNLVRTVRDKAVAHFDQDVARDAFRKLSPEEPMVDFHSPSEGNTIYFSGEALMLASLIHLCPEEDLQKALDGVADEILDVAKKVGNVVRAYLQVFSERHLSEQLSGLREERILIDGQPRLSAFAAPMYLAVERKAHD